MKLLLLLLVFVGTPCIAEELLKDLAYLASDELAGRKTGSEGNLKAAHYIKTRFENLGLAPFDTRFEQAFSYSSGFGSQKNGKNIVGLIKAKHANAPYLVITAHYDHLGNQGRRIFNGADDNASGVAALFALAKTAKQYPLNYNWLFVATDAEENGLYGAKALVSLLQNSNIPIILNINLDMLSVKGRNKRVFAFTDKRLAPAKSIIEQFNNNKSPSKIQYITSNYQANRRQNEKIDWRRASDHDAFRRANVPYIYFGVGIHPNYHTENDTFANIDPAFYQSVVEQISFITLALDQQKVPQLLTQ
ncbi:M28 family peptidase [Pseudoalteromonas tunicata]|uniref:M28 family peptidase n=1 Tax=Pseudoalteromonas tunicata TaxID=314281 RepID=UPI00273E3F52|nr:M28 family peptidase [Pseudoalteromonas tunicata]MDP4982792.1 M28 family peptidase [Pseudoalteromonas tunicata]